MMEMDPQRWEILHRRSRFLPRLRPAPRSIWLAVLVEAAYFRQASGARR